MLKIATWNLDRPKISTAAKNRRILDVLNEIDADILILTETNSCISPGPNYRSFATPSLVGSITRKGEAYEEDENRVTVWSRYQNNRLINSCNSPSSVCVAIETDFGELFLYGTVIGIYGNRDECFTSDIELQAADWRRLKLMGNICIAGDFNLSLGDNYYYTKAGRQKIYDYFQELGLKPLTKEILENIDHVVVSDSFATSATSRINVWNPTRDKKISDHMAVCVTLGLR